MHLKLQVRNIGNMSRAEFIIQFKMKVKVVVDGVMSLGHKA